MALVPLGGFLKRYLDLLAVDLDGEGLRLLGLIAFGLFLAFCVTLAFTLPFAFGVLAVVVGCLFGIVLGLFVAFGLFAFGLLLAIVSGGLDAIFFPGVPGEKALKRLRCSSEAGGTLRGRVGHLDDTPFWVSA